MRGSSTGVVSGMNPLLVWRSCMALWLAPAIQGTRRRDDRLPGLAPRHPRLAARAVPVRVDPMSRVLFDARHRWGDPIQSGARLTRVCQSCGKSQTVELLVPDSLVEDLIRAVQQPNPYRSALR